VDPVPDPLLFFGSAGNRTRVTDIAALTYEVFATLSVVC
jgi:hypothetical protein